MNQKFEDLPDTVKKQLLLDFKKKYNIKFFSFWINFIYWFLFFVIMSSLSAEGREWDLKNDGGVGGLITLVKVVPFLLVAFFIYLIIILKLKARKKKINAMFQAFLQERGVTTEMEYGYKLLYKRYVTGTASTIKLIILSVLLFLILFFIFYEIIDHMV